VGIIPETLYYARLLHYVQSGLDGQIEGRGEGLDAVRPLPHGKTLPKGREE